MERVNQLESESTQLRGALKDAKAALNQAKASSDPTLMATMETQLAEATQQVVALHNQNSILVQDKARADEERAVAVRDLEQVCARGVFYFPSSAAPCTSGFDHPFPRVP